MFRSTFLPVNRKQRQSGMWAADIAFLVTGLQVFRKIIPIYESKQQRSIGPIPWLRKEVHGVNTYLPLLSSFPPAPLAYVNQLKVHLAREACDAVITINRMNRQLDKHIIKNLGGGKEKYLNGNTKRINPRDFNQWSQHSFLTPLITWITTGRFRKFHTVIIS